MSDKLIPLSPTVMSIFVEFIKKLEAEEILLAAAIETLRQTFDQQKLDAESLRKAIFSLADTAQ
jgi:hypothetical protein